MYTNVIFQLTTNSANVKAFVEKIELKFNNLGIANITLIEGQQYSVYCYVSGKYGSNYELSIIEPKDIPLHIFKTIYTPFEEKERYTFSVSSNEVYSPYLP